MKKIGKAGQRYGRLVLLKPIEPYAICGYWECACDCGNKTKVRFGNLRSKTTVSCGCWRKTQPITHGMRDTKFYALWSEMLQRCNNPKRPYYKHYGGRGIKCLWESFEDFRDDMYEKYTEHSKKHGIDNTSLDRIDYNGHYCKENCRWATWKEQANNKRNNRYYTWRGKTYTLQQLSDELGISRRLITTLAKDDAA